MNFSSNSVAIIDSGLGGVSVLKQLIRKYKCGNYIYFADNLYMPYGNKSKTFIKHRVDTLINLLQSEYKVNKVIIACNTASTTIDVAKYRNVYPMTFNKNHTYLATNLTKKNLPEFNVVADKTLATLIEQHILEEAKLKQIVKAHIRAYNLNRYTEIVLGCTHYELVYKYFKKFAPNVNFINNSDFIIKNIKLEQSNELNVVLIMSKYSEVFYIKFKHTISF